MLEVECWRFRVP